MLFRYKAVDQDGHEREGTIEAPAQELAVTALQRRNLIISVIEPAEKDSFFRQKITFFAHISNKEIVILSRQIATLFEAQVSALRVFRLLAAEVDNERLASILNTVADDIQGGTPMSRALARHPKVFSTYYVNMVKAGEESGKLSMTFLYLADYLDRTYEVMNKAQNALIYPAFVVCVFFAVMSLMLTLVIPNISSVLADAGGDIPVYTKVVIGISEFLVQWGLMILVALLCGAVYVWQLAKTEKGKLLLDSFKISLPYIGDLYRKLYLARIADSFSTMILAGVSVVEAFEITASVVGNAAYATVLREVEQAVKGGASMSDAFSRYPEIPGIMIAMTRVGEETGELGQILATLTKFYNREVVNAVDTLVGLIEPVMIVFLGVGVGVLMAAVLLPVYNLAAAI
jgi:type IV pilus assembly protein PilC